MIKLVALLLVLVFPGVCFAGPFLVCDPYPEELGVDNFVLVLDGIEMDSPAQILADNTTRLYYDLVGIASGTHHVEVAAENVWGQSVFVPFDFTKQLPGGPSNIGLEE